ncbi:hypothetical protein BOX09_gp31 [Flavobacterium phage Fpv1]|uniref:Uncharacterized protein n=2 Tax=Fipvunavirus Fpv1 TaxID=2560475 RepID=A0A1B0WKR4_9CAUD|nr:hypothetical protein BOW81_gp31 [Flavobacterium phage Fpv20]YP_009322033.1 hypothetical protein BOX09_gp31 [Flavobacterium phage Fpv1]YP_009323622.1 hypothetical protein BOW82_gp31 [Flavobacterium phage Fpv2]ALN97277.1 hypothetical protein [Flavobacterium phage FpV21]QCW20312.1 hypothetical protein [Flavobacterium phage FPSV-F12]ANB40273.1 hypothetical protein [Flavobacterium phage Fpv1]ANB40353.1 hypothetical protein [Flavobacterium phage Fpv2]ANB40860.1 hypothetical protein [Flavobacter
MKKKSPIKKKYGYGSSGTISPQLENPMNAIYQSQIDRAYAGSQNSDLVDGLNMFGGAAIGIGGQMMAAGKMDGDSGFAKFVNNNGKGIMSGLSTINASSQFLATGGIVNSNAPVEVEGQEVMETPNGEVSEIEGASHEQGGVDMNVPEGTKIYSKRIEKFGKTMAERKKVREKKLTNLNKLLENSKGDIAVKNAHARSIEALNEQEQADLQTQEMYGVIAAVHEFAFGTDENGVRKYGGGTGPGGIEYDEFGNPIIKDLLQSQMITPGVVGTAKSVNKKYATVQNKPEAPDYMKNLQSSPVLSFANNFGETLPENKDYGAGEFIKGFDKGEPDTISLTDEEVLNKGGKYDGYSNPELAPEETSIDKPGSVVSRFVDGVGKFVGKSNFKIPGAGDMVGMAGNIYSAFAPMNNTLENRAGDTPNVNSFKDYGQEGLATLDKTKGYINQIKDNKLQDSELDRTGTIKRNNNSARGVNTMRALNLATDANVNNQKDNIQDVFAQQMMTILGQEAGMKNQKDQVVMGGEQEKDLNDRKDRDNFYTQLGKDKSTMGEGVQHIGKDLNAMKQNKIKTDIINDGISHNGLAYDENYKMIFKGVKEDDMTDDEKEEANLFRAGYKKDSNGNIVKITK